MKKINITLMIVGLAVFAVVPVLAATYTLTATDKIYSADWSNFSLQYYDLDNDQKFSYDELIPGTFSGVRDITRGIIYTRIIGVPLYSSMDSPFTDGGGDCTYGCYGSKDSWDFAQDIFPGGTVSRPTASTWTYTQTPVPSALWLLGSGLIGLAGLRRRRKVHSTK